MKKTILVITLIFCSAFGAFAQLENPVSWSYAAKKISKTEAVVYLKATIDEGWHMYSQNLKPGGPIKTTFSFKPSKDFTLLGKTIEPKPISQYEKVYKTNLTYFETEVVFQQKIKLSKASTTVKGIVEFMVCNDKSCLPPSEVSFSIPVK